MWPFLFLLKSIRISIAFVADDVRCVGVVVAEELREYRTCTLQVAPWSGMSHNMNSARAPQTLDASFAHPLDIALVFHELAEVASRGYHLLDVVGAGLGECAVAATDAPTAAG